MNDWEFEQAEREYERILAVRGKICRHCLKDMFYDPDKGATEPGHVYSQAGVAEVSITGICEYCFDQITMEPEYDL